MSRVLIALTFLISASVFGIQVRDFEDPVKQRRYERLIKDLRCLVCQNQSLADSDADLAEDLRDEVYRMVQSGKSERESVAFLVERYGDFVLYRPPFNAVTTLLWIGPFLVLGGGVLVLWHQTKRRNADHPQPLSPAEKDRLRQIKDRLGAD